MSKAKIISFISIILPFLFSCSLASTKITAKDLEGKKWVFKYADDCINTLEFFEDSTYLEYFCERQENFFGKFEIKNDSLYIYEKGYIEDVSGNRIPNNKNVAFVHTIENERLCRLYRIDDEAITFKIEEEYCFSFKE